jgi:pantoate--beta-alanine ligase
VTEPEVSYPLTVLRTAAELRAATQTYRDEGKLIGLVPTMGALHQGHLALVDRAARDCGLVIASLFVNPTQFGEGEDFDAYPRNEADDIAKFDAHGVDFVYAPDAAEIYPAGLATTVTVSGITEGLCGATRPGHFDGVTTVVSRLFEHCAPDVAYFGEKDYQQYKVVQRLVEQLGLDIRVVGITTVRERDGLALSSRNAYLNPGQRRAAPAMYGTMFALAGRLHDGVDIAAQCAWGAQALLDAGFDSVDYFEICDADTLIPATGNAPNLRILAAARLGKTRLIDNMPVDPPD